VRLHLPTTKSGGMWLPRQYGGANCGTQYPRQFGGESVRPTFLGQRLEHELVIERVKWYLQPGAIWRHARLMTHVITDTGAAHAKYSV
jgi:hypothetical protein